MRSLLLCLLLTSTTAAAVPTTMTQQGRMFDQNGDPMDGSFNLTFALYNVPSGGAVLWQEAQSTAFDNGYYAAELGEITNIDSALFDDDELYLGITVGAGAELPGRIRLRAVPFAIRAGVADGVAEGAVIDASEVAINGTTVIDSSGSISYDQLVDIPADPFTSLGCADGEIPRVASGVWSCVADNDHVHSADALTSGVIVLDRLPTGTGPTNVALGDHGHSAADVGALPIGGGTLTGALSGTTGSFTGDLSGADGSFTGAITASSASFTGSVLVGDDANSCTAGIAGAIRWTGTFFEGCDGTDWMRFDRPGELAASGSYADCKAIRDAAGGGPLPSGRYTIDPDGNGAAAPFQVECDMETDGGGWTLLVRHDYRFDDCPGDLQKHSAQWGCFRNTGPQIRTATFSAMGLAYQEVRGAVDAHAVGSMEAFNGTNNSGGINSRYVDGLGIFTASDTHVWTYALGTWPECSTCACPNDIDGGTQPAFVGDNFDCGANEWVDYRWYAYLLRDTWFQRDLGSPTTDDLVISMQTDQATSNEDMGLRKLQLWVR